MNGRDLNRRVFLANLSSVGICSMVKAAPVATTYPFYAMDTGLRGPDVPSLEKKVALLAKLGFAGIGWTWNASEAEPLLKLLDQYKLQLWAVYLAPFMEDAPDKALLTYISSLKGRPTRIELALRSKKYKPSDPEGDKIALQYAMPYVEQSKDSGPVISFYPHRSFWLEKVEDGLRLASKANLTNLGTHFNLVHWRWQNGTDEKKILEIGKKHIFCMVLKKYSMLTFLNAFPWVTERL